MGFKPRGLTPTRDLPESYVAIWSLNLAKNHLAAVTLNIAGLPLFFFFGWIFIRMASALRPGIVNGPYLIHIVSQPFLFFLVFFSVVAGIMVVHEIIHGVFFWVFTHSRPIFGMKLLFAYAGAPAWYIPKLPYVIIGVAPFIVLTLAGFAVIQFAGFPVGQLALFGITMNASGSVGDFYVAARTVLQPGEVLVQDTGVGFTMFGKTDSALALNDQPVEGAVNHE